MILLPNPQISVDPHYKETYKTHKICNKSIPGCLVQKKKKNQMSSMLVDKTL